MKKIIFSVLLTLFMSPVFANYDLKFDSRTIAFNEDELKFYENGVLLSKDDVQKLFPDYEIVLISQFDKDKKIKISNKRMKQKKILLLNDEKYRTFHLFYIYPTVSRSEFQNYKNGEIKSLITVYGKKNVRLKHFGGDEFILDVR